MVSKHMQNKNSGENSECLSANIGHWLTPPNIQGKKEYLKKNKLHEKST